MKIFTAAGQDGFCPNTEIRQLAAGTLLWRAFGHQIDTGSHRLTCPSLEPARGGSLSLLRSGCPRGGGEGRGAMDWLEGDCSIYCQDGASDDVDRQPSLPNCVFMLSRLRA